MAAGEFGGDFHARALVRIVESPCWLTLPGSLPSAPREAADTDTVVPRRAQQNLGTTNHSHAHSFGPCGDIVRKDDAHGFQNILTAR